MPRSRPAMLAAAILIALSWLAIAALAPRQYPLHHDTPANFWFSITGVKLPSAPTPNFHGNFAIIDRDRIVYGYEYPFTPAPDMPYQMVSIDEAARDFPAVERELKRRAALHNPDDYPAEGFQHWSASEARELAAGTGYTPTTDYRIRTLLPSIDQARSEWKLTDVDDFQYAAPAYTNFQTGLVHVANAARLYWATIAFEALLFPALILFALWPFIHRQRFRRKLLHITLLPLLLYLPAWLGYCNSASPAYPVGGIIYPCVNWPFYAPLDNFLWEFGFLSHLPPIFYPITQGRTLTYADYYTWKPSIPYQLGPVNVAIFCAVAAACCLAIKAAHTLYQKRRRAIPGFPVLPHDPATAAPPTLSSSPRT